MTQALPLEDRVAKLEHQMAEVQFMTGRTDREVSDLQAVLNGHTGVLNAIRDDQVDQGKRLARVEAEMRSGFAEMRGEFADVRTEMRTGFAKVDANFTRVDANFAKVDANFAKVDANFAKVEDKFKVLQQGQARITELLTKRLGESGEEAPSGDGGE